MTAYDVRAGELMAWSASTGKQLPMSIPEILALEDAGHVVDLETGIVLIEAADVKIGATIVGEAVIVVLEAEGTKT